ncbi:MAG: Zn-ribbon containing protein [archaeon]
MHQCLKCKATYEDDAVPILNGCTCGSRMFLFIKQDDDIERIEIIRDELESKIQEIEQEAKIEETAPAKKPKKRFGIETIKIKDIGVYEINIDALMKGRPIVVLSKSGSYIISLPSVFGRESDIELR